MYLDPMEPHVLIDQAAAQALLRVLGCSADYGFSAKEWGQFQNEHVNQTVSQLQDAARFHKHFCMESD